MDVLRALGTFVRVADVGSFSAVARESNSSSSAVTRMISQLEDHFGARLFHRTTRHLSLTEDGQDLLTHARPIIDAAEELNGVLRHQRTSPKGRVRVGVTAGAARLLTATLAALFERYPGLSVEFVVREHLGDMIEDRLDVAMSLNEPPDSSLVTRAVSAFGQAVIAAPNYLEKRGAPVTPGDLRAHNCIVLENGAASRHWHFKGPDGPHDIEVSGTFSANNSDVVRQAALSGHGIALLPEAQVFDDILSSRLYRLLPDYPTVQTKLFLVYPSRRHMPPRTRVVIDFLIDRFSSAAARLTNEQRWGGHDTAWLV